MPTVLFVCTGNVYRSPLASAFFLKRLRRDGRTTDWEVESAGTWAVPGQALPDDVLKLSARYGMDLKDHRTRQVGRELLEAFDVIFVMERGHLEALNFEFPSISNRLHLLSDAAEHLIYDIPDPAASESGLEVIADGLFKLIERGYQNLVKLAQGT